VAADLPLLTFADAATFEAWLADQPDDAPGAWLCFAKAGGGQATVSKSDAIDSALAYGWVDGQIGAVDDAFFKTRFTPRTASSRWSQINRDRVTKLVEAGRMTLRGQAEVDRAKADGRWDAAYAPQSQAEIPRDLKAALEAAPRAAAFFGALDSANRYAVLYRVHHAKPGPPRAKKIEALVAQLARGEAIHPRRAKSS
jgi:uncharacterized protein YdeI (YjbR/CyaY-like superfamily)